MGQEGLSERDVRFVAQSVRRGDLLPRLIHTLAVRLVLAGELQRLVLLPLLRRVRPRRDPILHAIDLAVASGVGVLVALIRNDGFTAFVDALESKNQVL